MKNFLFIGLFIAFAFRVNAQVNNWQNKDMAKDGVFGVSTDRAYSELLRNRKANTVTVTIIDSGIDTLHDDLRSVIWHNKREIPGNGIDDEKNGFTDDIIGWNFTGLSVKRDTLLNLIAAKGAFYDSLAYAKVPDSERAGFKRFMQLRKELESNEENLKQLYDNILNNGKLISELVSATGKTDPTLEDFKNLLTKEPARKKLLAQLINFLPAYKDYLSFKSRAIDSVLKNIGYAVRNLQNQVDSAKVLYYLVDSNNDSTYDRVFTLPDGNDFQNLQPFTFHGTHIAGIIGADRTNHIGAEGVADHVKIMSLKIYSALFPELREEKLAKAIRYAVDKGSRVINLSLYMSSVSDSKVLDDAIRYAMLHNVLIVRAAGNEGINIDNMPGRGIYPTKFYQDGGQAEAWLTVGASGWKDDDSLAAWFSNYGKASVDVFAPGVRINSTIPGNRYQQFSGTSMATPVVVGLAALIMEYYPKLTAQQVKEIIMRSVRPVDHDVFLPGKSAVKTKVPFKSLCVSGGIVNAYRALKLAATY